MPVSRVKKMEVVRRRQAVADLYVQGHSQISIAQSMGVSQATISGDLRHIQDKWRESAIKDVGLVRTRELEKLDRIERECWAAWQRSQKPSQEAVMTTNGSTQRTQKKVVEQVGDVRFLEQISKCITARRALLGLDAPTKIAPTDPSGEKAYHSHVMAELMRLSEHVAGGPDVIDATLVEAAMDVPAIEHNASASGTLYGALADSHLQEPNAT